MINRLFASFDPMGRILSTNYFILLLCISLPISLSIFKIKIRSVRIFSDISSQLTKELSAAIPNKNKHGKNNIIISLFFIILVLNLGGLVPYVYTITAQMLFTLSVALPLWLGFLLFSAINNTNHFIRHLVPISTPLPLSQFMVLIERVRQIIRPITLSVRLAANITAGHILIALCSNTINVISPVTSVLLILLILETAVAFIQRYVFTVLISIYLREALDRYLKNKIYFANIHCL